MSAATPPPPPPLARAQAPSPSYHPFGARQPPRWTGPYVPRGYTRATAAAHRTWYPPSKKKCKSFVPFTSNFPLAHAPRRLTKNLAPQGHLDKFFFFFSSFSFSSGTGAGQRRSQHHCHLLPLHTRRPPLLAHHHIT